MISKNMKAFLKDVKKIVPSFWFRDGEEFDGSKYPKIWTTAEHYYEELDGAPAFNIYTENNPKIEALLKKHSLYAEFYDSGTVFIYEV